MSGAGRTNEPRSDADRCFVCGPENPIGLRISFTLEGGCCRGTFTSTDDHVGFDGVTHGGIVFSVLDDAMANWFFLQGARGFTARAEIRYREAMPSGATADVECALVRRKGRLVQLRAVARNRDSGNTIAESEGSFMLEELGELGAA